MLLKSAKSTLYKQLDEYVTNKSILEPARGGMVGAAGQGNPSDERCRGTRLVPSAPTRGLPIPRHCDAGQNPPDGCVSQPSPPVFEIQKK